MHTVLYLLPFALFASGYLISTADGRPLVAFGIPLLPSLVTGEGLEDIAGAVHLGLAITLMAMVALHAAAALKHHFVDGDRTLLRMLGSGRRIRHETRKSPASRTP
jgi:cytochrome b561